MNRPFPMGSGKINGAEGKLLKGSSFTVRLTLEPVNSHAKFTGTPVLSGFPRGWPTDSLIHA